MLRVRELFPPSLRHKDRIKRKARCRKMKMLSAILTLLLLIGCAPKDTPSVPAGTPANEPQQGIVLWTRTDAPTEVDYHRMWLYSAEAHSEDPAVLEALAAAIRALKVGARSDQMTTDYTDVLVFSFADGETLRLEFENQCVVMADDTRYAVEGLRQVRTILDELIGEDE